MAAEREAHAKREQEIKDRAARENRESYARMERDLAEQEAAQRRESDKADAQARVSARRTSVWTARRRPSVRGSVSRGLATSPRLFTARP